MSQPSHKKKRHRTQLFIAQRSKMTAQPKPPEEPPPEEPEQDIHSMATPALPVYDVHNKPTLPMGHYAALSESFKFENPFERDSTGEHETSAPSPPTQAPTPMLEDARPLLMHKESIEHLRAWHIATHHDTPVIAWQADNALHLRDEHGIHHIIGLSGKTLSAIHHDTLYTWFATTRGRLFRFDRASKKLVLASSLARKEPIVVIYTDAETKHLVLVSRDGRMYQGTPERPGELERAGRSLNATISCGAFDPEHHELILITTQNKMLRVCLTQGAPPLGRPIMCEQPIAAITFARGARVLHLQLEDVVQTYTWGSTPRLICTTPLPPQHCGLYLVETLQQMHVLCTRGSVLLHTPLM